MKKIISIVLFSLLITSTAAAQDVWTGQATIVSPAELVIDNSTPLENQEQEKVIYNYYYSPTCKWCQQLDNFLKKHDAYSQLEINKIDVRSRGEEMIQAAEEHGINPASVWTPFVTYGPNGTWAAIQSGYYGALDLFADALWVDNGLQTQEEKDMNRLFVILFGLIIIIGPLAYLGLKK